MNEMEELARVLGFEFEIREVTPRECLINGVPPCGLMLPTHAAFDADGDHAGSGMSQEDAARDVIVRGVNELRGEIVCGDRKLSEVRNAVHILVAL